MTGLIGRETVLNVKQQTSTEQKQTVSKSQRRKDAKKVGSSETKHKQTPNT